MKNALAARKCRSGFSAQHVWSDLEPAPFGMFDTSDQSIMKLKNKHLLI